MSIKVIALFSALKADGIPLALQAGRAGGVRGVGVLAADQARNRLLAVVTALTVEIAITLGETGACLGASGSGLHPHALRVDVTGRFVGVTVDALLATGGLGDIPLAGAVQSAGALGENLGTLLRAVVAGAIPSAHGLGRAITVGGVEGARLLAGRDPHIIHALRVGVAAGSDVRGVVLDAAEHGTLVIARIDDTHRSFLLASGEAKERAGLLALSASSTEHALRLGSATRSGEAL